MENFGSREQRRNAGRSDAVAVVIPNLSWRYSGVTATNRQIAPRLARTLRVAWFGSDRPDGAPPLRWRALWRMRDREPSGRPPIWHARRNIEMMVGLLLRRLGWPLALVFTSVAQRHHTFFTRWLLARMDAVIAPSALSAAFLQRPAIVIPHGVDAQLYRPPEDRAAAWAESRLPGRYGIGCFGRVRAQKGTDVFVAAMCRLLPRYPDYTAIVVGEITPDQRGFFNRLKAEVAAAGLTERIVFLGALPIAEVPVWYQRISIYAFTSRNEGFGLTLLEAMASGAALVAARAGAAALVVADGDTGLLVPPGDLDAMVAALERLMREPAKAARIGARARARAVAEFSIDAEAEKIAAVYRKVWETTRT
jgi:mannosyltransferase